MKLLKFLIAAVLMVVLLSPVDMNGQVSVNCEYVTVVDGADTSYFASSDLTYAFDLSASEDSISYFGLRGWNNSEMGGMKLLSGTLGALDCFSEYILNNATAGNRTFTHLGNVKGLKREGSVYWLYLKRPNSRYRITEASFSAIAAEWDEFKTLNGY